MNKKRRAEIAKAVGFMEEAKNLVAQAAEILTAVSDEEREYHNNMPEGLQASEKGEIADAAANALEEAASTVETMGDDIDKVLAHCEEASA